MTSFILPLFPELAALIIHTSRCSEANQSGIECSATLVLAAGCERVTGHPEVIHVSG